MPTISSVQPASYAAPAQISNATRRPIPASLTEASTTRSAFAQLGATPRTVRALARMGIETPTPIQVKAIPPLLAGRDVVGQSRTGSGKTIAFGLPLIECIEPRRRQLQALVLVPTRELAGQVAEVLAGLDANVSVAQLIGGRSLGPQREALRAGAQVAVGAPGRVLDLLRQGDLDLSELRIAVLDEADQMLDVGFAPDVERILSATPPTRQMALFSATMPEWVDRVAKRYLREPVRLQTDSTEGRPAPAITQIVYMVPQGRRLAALTALLDRRRDASGTTLVFGRTKHGVKKLAKQLTAQGYTVAALQGNMSQNARDRVLADFRAGNVPVLLATNVAARGIDVDSIELVINYELPESSELFTHRVGRTGRMEREGEAITLLTPEDMDAWKKIQRGLSIMLQPRPWPLAQMPLPDAPAIVSIAPQAPAQPLRGDRAFLPTNARPARRPVVYGDERAQPFADHSRRERSRQYGR
ncbi:MAG TPA: DEAD/DEAH box helicase [Ktedonobacterales bacterium]|nr:DEAD/DEAH box helicase [Ktedonobacterales bacterium]